MAIKEIQAGYLMSPCFKNICSYLVLPFGNIYHLSWTNSVPTHWPACINTCYTFFDHLEFFCRGKIRNINVLEVFLCFFQ